MSEIDNLQFYDLIIDVDSFKDLKPGGQGWKINMEDKGQEKFNYFSDTENKKDIEKREVNRIGMLGASGVGKTFILGKLLNNKDLKTNTINTRGISVIYPELNCSDKLFTCIDSKGSEEPIIDEKMTPEEIYDLNDEEKKKRIEDSSKDKKFIEIFIQDFIIEKSNVLIVVVDQLKFSEQKLINRLKSHNFDKLFVIHNLQFFCDMKTIEEHIENVIKKSVFSNLEKVNIPYFDDDKEKKQKPYYFYEKEFGKKDQNKSKQEIIHLFMAKEDSPAGKYFNEETIKYITYIISSQCTKKVFNIEEELKDFLSLNSIQYMIKENNENKPISEEDLSIETNNDGKFLKCKKDFKLKNCVINQMGISIFSKQNSINPSFICYKGNYKKYKPKSKEIAEQWPALIIKTEMFVDPKEINVLPVIGDDYETMMLSIYCNKTINKDDDIEEVETIDGDIREGEVRIDIKLNLDDIVLDPNNRFVVNQSSPGIMAIFLKIVDDQKAQENIKKETVKKKKDKKKTKSEEN
jgi:hypothetical protein